MNLVSVLVPEEMVLDVYRLVSETHPRVTAPPEQQSTEDWEPAEIQRCFRDSSPAMKAIFRTLASRPDEDLELEDFYKTASKAAGRQYGWREVMGVLGAFGRRCKNRYQKKSWPFQAAWNPVRKLVIYRMDADVARLISDSE